MCFLLFFDNVQKKSALLITLAPVGCKASNGSTHIALKSLRAVLLKSLLGVKIRNRPDSEKRVALASAATRKRAHP
jgi:hypothetical protein